MAWKKIQVCSGFEPMTSLIPVHCSSGQVWVSSDFQFFWCLKQIFVFVRKLILQFG